MTEKKTFLRFFKLCASSSYTHSINLRFFLFKILYPKHFPKFAKKIVTPLANTITKIIPES